MPIRRALAAALLVAACLAPAAASGASPFHGAARAGAFVPTTLDRFGTGFEVELAGGWWATPRLSLELALGRGTVSGPSGPLGLGGAPAPETRLTLHPVTATARWSAWLGSLRPYLSAGAGLVVVRARGARIPAEGFPLTGEWTEAAPAAHAGAGLVFQADERFAFGLEGRYRVARVDRDAGLVKLDGVSVNATMELRL